MSVALIGFAAALVGALFTYLGIVRRASGRIATSEASRLWDESAAIRETFRLENEALRARVDTLERRTDELGGDNRTLRQLNDALRTRIVLLEDRLKALGGKTNGGS